MLCLLLRSDVGLFLQLKSLQDLLRIDNNLIAAFSILFRLQLFEFFVG
jgi:hypothetical protein